MLLDIKNLEDSPTDKLPGFSDRLKELIPTLIEHRCSPGHRGGFFERLDRGTWAGHIVEHVAIELQCLAGMEVGFGKTVDTPRKGVYEVVFRYRDEEVGLMAGNEAVRIIDALVKKRMPNIPRIVLKLKEIRERNLLGPSTRSIADEASSRGIPVIRLNDQSFVQLGHGINQRRVQATMMDDTSAVGVEIADDKDRTKKILAEAGIPVPAGQRTLELDEAYRIAEEIGYPVAVKPLHGNHGKGITTPVSNRRELKMAFKVANRNEDEVIIEKHIPGHDFRILVIDGKVAAAARREPAHVVGDGASTIHQLIDRVNESPNRGVGHEKVLTRINIDFMTRRLLKQRGFGLDDVLEKGEVFILKSTANMSTGATASDVTDELHPSNQYVAEHISRLVGLNVMGVDIIAPNLSVPMKESGGAVVEVNAAPGFRMHLRPSHGMQRNVASPILDMLFPPGTPATIPIVAVTGTNGKTTTVRLISHMLKYCGKSVGMCCTGTVVIENYTILEGDYSGPYGARHVLMDPVVDHAVFEVARGGILRSGLGFDDCDVGVMLNISSDHLGQGGLDSLEDLASVKGVVVESVKPDGHAILNADDPLVLSFKDNIRASSILISLDKDNPAIIQHVSNGGIAVTANESAIILRDKSIEVEVAKLIDVPLTFEGRARFNVQNVLAAVGATYSLGLTVEDIHMGLRTFSSSVGQNPGRMNLRDVGGFKVIIDYCHNVGAVEAMSEVVPFLGSGRKISMVAGTGNRRDKDIEDFGQALARVYDKLVITDTDPRDRAPGETAKLVLKGVLSIGFSPDDVTIVIDGREATRKVLGMARDGDLLVIQADDFQQVLADVMAFKESLVKDRS